MSNEPCKNCGHAGKLRGGICRQIVGAECLDPYGEECGCKCEEYDYECDGTNCPPRAHDHKLLI